MKTTKKLMTLLLALLGMTQADAQENGYLPIVREGVKWVNEKVIVNNGDTTRYYYKYEFNGEDDSIHANMEFDINKACYYYTGHHLDVENDSLIAGLREKGGEVTFFRNNAYYKNLEEGRMMFNYFMATDGGTVWLYSFGDYGCDDYYFNIMYYEELYGGNPALTIDNFKKVDPITIEGIECERYAYIGEDGDTLAYVIEGIGFDSRDMGDLLTPFTRRPDPNADYQEWCGLSHVVKDGKIIYKGMRYREGAFDEGDDDTDGDVNGDGDVNITDANSVIEIIINGGNGHDRINEHGQIIGDVNLDGVVNISDLNYIIQIILTNN
jgi:hypothetical protein